ncbi:MAG: ferrochelatase [Gammaproteobacteria bacterium]
MTAASPPFGVLVSNLGTPELPTRRAVRRFLAAFLADPRVVELPRWLWLPVLYGVILPLRPRRAVHAYQSIWTEAGSPLLALSQRQAVCLQEWLEVRLQTTVPVALGMRYGQPSIGAGLELLRARGVRCLIVLPLYPQYSAVTTASTFDAVAAVLRRWRVVPALHMVNGYHDDPGYIDAVAGSIAAAWSERAPAQRLLFSFHGLPERSHRQGDPYADQCRATARLIAQQLRLGATRWALAFQSRVGPREWLKPYTDEQLSTWARQGVVSVDTVCPGFSADCLETLEEMALRNRDLFLRCGGQTFHYIAALNATPGHIQALGSLVLRHAGGWTEPTRG